VLNRTEQIELNFWHRVLRKFGICKNKSTSVWTLDLKDNFRHGKSTLLSTKLVNGRTCSTACWPIRFSMTVEGCAIVCRDGRRRDSGIGINVKMLSLAVLTPNVPWTLSKHQWNEIIYCWSQLHSMCHQHAEQLTPVAAWRHPTWLANEVFFNFFLIFFKIISELTWSRWSSRVRDVCAALLSRRQLPVFRRLLSRHVLARP